MVFRLGWKDKEHVRLDKKLITNLTRSRFPSARQMKYMNRVIGVGERKILGIATVVLVVNVIFLGWRGYVHLTREVPKEGGQYTEGLVGSPQYVNPILLQNNDADRDLTQLVFSGLMRYDHNRAIVTDLAEKYEVSDGGKVYTFTLRDGSTWHDGEPVTADDVIFTVSRIQDTATKSPLYASFKDITVEKIDERTVKFVLDHPFAPFLDLATKKIIPSHLWGETQAEHTALAALNLRPVGSGPWKFKSLKKDRNGNIKSYVLERFDEYGGARSFLKKLTFKLYPDIDSAVQALKNRNVDGISFLPRELRGRLEKNRDIIYYTFRLPQYTALFFNPSANADLAQDAVRKALAHALDRDALIRDVLWGEAKKIDAPILEGFLGYSSEVSRYEYEPALAAKLLEEHGWRRGEGGVWTPVKKGGESEQLKVVITTVDKPEHIRVADMIKEQWKAFGALSEVQTVEVSRLKQDVIDPRNYQTLLYGHIIGSDPDVYPFWHSSQAKAPGLNITGFVDKKADEILEKGRETIDPLARAKLYEEFQKILTKEAPAVFLYNPSFNYVVSRDIKGIADEKNILYPSDRFIDISSWYIKTKRVLK